MAEFSGKVAIVTGGALGIRRAAARKLAREGASVVICSDREEQVEGTVAGLRDEGLEVRGMRADVTSSADMKRLVGFAAETYGGVDVLVNSAGVQLALFQVLSHAKDEVEGVRTLIRVPVAPGVHLRLTTPPGHFRAPEQGPLPAIVVQAQAVGVAGY